jgi:hypothetical protein
MPIVLPQVWGRALNYLCVGTGRITSPAGGIPRARKWRMP